MRLWVIFIALFNVALLSVSAFSQTQNAPLETTITEISKAPWSYHDKWVRVSGTFDECYGGACSICDSGFPEDRYGDQKIECMGVNFLDQNQESFVRYSTVEILARYSAHCTGKENPKNLGESYVCTGRATELHTSIVTRKITEHFPSREQEIEFGAPRLVEPNDAEKDVIIDELLTDLPSWYNLEPSEIRFVFLMHDKDSDTRQVAICECHAEEEICNKNKPIISEDIFYQRSTSPLACILGEERSGRWHVAPN